MKRTLAIVLSLLGSVSVSVSVFAAVGRTEPALREVGPPIGPLMAPDTGGGELLVVVVGGVYPTRAEAEAVQRNHALRGYVRLLRRTRGPVPGLRSGHWFPR